MSLPEQVYTVALRTTRPLLSLLARGESKLARGVRGRRGVLERFEQWAAAERDPSRPLIWFHAPSAGEGLQARAVMEVIRRLRPNVQLAYTFFSPSAEAFARTVPADVADYLPLDVPPDPGRALDLLRPAVVAFTKTEVWPNLSREAKRRGTGLALLSATLPPTSSRLGGVARPFLAPAYGRLDCLAAISLADAERYDALGVPPERRTVMGDARFDQVWRRAASANPDSDLLRPLRDAERLTLVAGSTWPADEERLIPALRDTWNTGARLRLILVPHEPTPRHLTHTEVLLRQSGFSAQRLSELGGAAPIGEVVLVDRVGVLGDLYALAEVAYVGGGWGHAGIHSVLEPAAFGVPVLFGPYHDNAREAGELVAAGGAFSAPDERILSERLRELVREPAARERAGKAARAYVQVGLGAAERGARVVLDLLDQHLSADH